MKKLLLLFVLFAAQILFAADVYKITSDVLLENPANCGVNAFHHDETFAPWNSSMDLNMWNAGTSFGPLIFRHNLLLKNTDGSSKEALCSKGSGGDRLSPWDMFPDHFWDGADIHIYRINRETKTLDTVHHTTVKEWLGSDESGSICYYTEPGGVAKSGDIVVLTLTTSRMPELPGLPRGGKIVRDRRNDGHLFKTTGTNVVFELDAADVAPDGQSRASMKLTLPGGGSAPGLPGGPTSISGRWHWYLADHPTDPWLKFRTGKEYACELWLKGDGITQAAVQVGAFTTAVLNITGEWKQYSFDIPNSPLPPCNPTGGVQPPKLVVGSDQPGTLWVDSMIVYQKDVEPFGLDPEFVATLKAFAPGSIRIGTPLDQKTVDEWLSAGFAKGTLYDWNKGIQNNTSSSAKNAFELCERTGADPWLILYPLYDEQECLNLMEYIAGPVDTPYGKLRAQHGHPAPWIDSMTIYLECANEPWNQIFQPLAWPGNGVGVYVAIANTTFENLKKSPYFNADKIKFVAGGQGTSDANSQYGSWNRSIIEDTVADVMPLGFYFGGADGVTVLGDSDEELYQRRLLYSAQINEPQLEKNLAGRDARGPDKKLAIYEFGPGYPLPDAKKPYSDADEEIGKSLALGLVTLDNVMFCSARGIGPIGYYLYGTGNNWATHTDPDQMIPYPAWLAMQLRNTQCKGDLLKADEHGVKTFDMPQMIVDDLDYRGNVRKETIKARENIAWTRCYPFRDGSRYSFLMFNRSFTEPKEITLDLPYAPSPEAELHMLTAESPRVTNRKEYNVKITESKIGDFKNGYTVTVPPGSICVLVNNAK